MTNDGVLLFFNKELTQAFVWSVSGTTGLYVIDQKDFPLLWSRLEIGVEVAFSARESTAIFYVEDIHSINGMPVSCQAG